MIFSLSRSFYCIQCIIYPIEVGFANSKHIENAVNSILGMHDVKLEKMDLKIKN